MIDFIKKWDAFGKTHDDYRTKTVFGGLMAIISTLIVVGLLLFEVNDFFKVEWRPEFTVDHTREDKMTIHIDIEFPQVPCFALTLDVMDAADQFQNNMHDNLVKTRLDSKGNKIGIYDGDKWLDERPADYCGSCYKAKMELVNGSPVCCNSCSQIYAFYEKMGLSPPKDMNEFEQCRLEGWKEKLTNNSNEGCRINGWFNVNKVSGNFHFAPGKSIETEREHYHDLRFIDKLPLDFKHQINFLSFGEIHKKIKNPLDNFQSDKTISKDHQPKSYSYYLKVVGTNFNYRSGKVMKTNQFAVTKNERIAQNDRMKIPCVFFHYDISPTVVNYNEWKRSIPSLFTNICAIIGGVYTIAALIDTIVFHAEQRIRQKRAIGKAY